MSSASRTLPDIDRLGVGERDRVTALEIDAQQRLPVDADGNGAGSNDYQRKDKSDVPQLEEIEARRFDELQHREVRLFRGRQNPVEGVPGSRRAPQKGSR